MSDSNPSNDGGRPRQQQLNLQQVAQQFMAGLQRHFDMLAFNLASRESVKEAAYNQRVHAPHIMPAAPRHQNFEQMQAYARDLLVRQVLGDALNLAVTGMNNAHFFLAVIKATEARPQVGPEAQKAAEAAQKTFVQAPIDEKFNRLEKDYGIMCEMEDTITSIGFAMQVLMRQGGVVRADQVDEEGELGFDLKTVELTDNFGPDGKPQAKVVDRRKVFREGEALVFSDVELQLVLVAIASFADALFKSVAQYARSFQQEGGA
ncbi:MAG: hypothetical protein ACOC4K_05250 [Verrucomicrobiota bacterium]